MTHTTLFVANLTRDVARVDLEDYFSYYGRLERVSLVRDKPIAFVEFRKEYDARRAQRGMDGAVVNGVTLCVSFAKNLRRSNQRSRSRSRNLRRGRSPLLRRSRSRSHGDRHIRSRSRSESEKKRDHVEPHPRYRSRSFSRSLTRD